MLYPILSVIFGLSLIFGLIGILGLFFRPRIWRSNQKPIKVFYVSWFGIYFFFILFFTGPQDLSLYPKQSEAKYKLPWEAGVTRCLSQGNRSFTSHRGLHHYAWDFVMPMGAKILAAREGKVRKVIQHFSGVGLNDNYIWIEHPDHQISNYGHFQNNGSLVKEGDLVQQGQPIALNGMVGQTTLPHLHFDVFNPEATESIPISFQDVKGGVPFAGHCYTSENQIRNPDLNAPLNATMGTK